MPQSTTPLRIEAIAIELNERPRESLSIVLKVDGKAHEFSEVKSGQPLHWSPDFVITIHSSSQLKLKLRSKSRKRLTFIPRFPDSVEVLLAGDEVLKVCSDTSSTTRVLKKTTKAFTATITFAVEAASIVASKLAAEKAVQGSNEILEVLNTLDGVRAAVDPIMKVLGEVATVHPIAKAAISAVTAAYDHLKKQAQCDSNVTDLATNMLAMLSAVEVAKDNAKIKHLLNAIEDILILIEDAAKFIVRYQMDGLAMRALKSLVSSTSKQVVDDYVKRFRNLKEIFDRGSNVQILGTLNDIDDKSVLGALTQSPFSQYNPSDACMEGTRERILQDIEIWTTDVSHSKHLLWISALAGAGKTAISSSIAKYLDDRKCLGACYFFKRGFSSPVEFIPTIVSRLAEIFQPFRRALVDVLRNNGGLGTHSVPVQFARLMEEPIQKLNDHFVTGQSPGPGRVFVVVVDALDECGSPDRRREVLLCIEKMAHLAPWLKVMCTSRPEPDVVRRFKSSPACYPFFLDINENTEDIVQVTRAKMKECAEMNSLPDTWPGEGNIQQLVQRSSGLFIWVMTAFKFISGALDPDLCMERVLAKGMMGDAYDSLDELYTTALGENMRRQDNIGVFQKVVGLILTARTPLPAEILAEFLKDSVSMTAVNNILGALGSVLYTDTTRQNAVRVCHPSFIDFLTDPARRCPEELRISPSLHSSALADVCLTTMERRLKFNICHLESSHLFTKDIQDLDDRIKTAIPGHLRYSCLYWASHVSDVSAKDSDLQRAAILQRLETFFSGGQFLYWLEVLSIIRALASASPALHIIRNWVSEPEHRCFQFATDGRRFIDNFHEVISLSTPHLYISALPFAPKNSLITTYQHSLFSNSIMVVEGQRMHWSPMLQVLRGHKARVICVAFSPDSRRIASGSRDTTIQTWDADTGTAITTPFEGHTSSVNALAFSQDNQRIVSGSSDRTVRIWDADTGAAILVPLEGHTAVVASVAFSPDSRRIASGSDDCTVRIWDAETGAVTWTLDGHTRTVGSVAFSLDNQRLVSGSSDRTIQIWDVDRGVAISTPLEGHTAGVTSVMFSPDNRRIVSGSHDDTIRIWDAGTGAPISMPFKGHTLPVTSIAFFPDSRRIISGSNDKTIRVWDADTGAEISLPLEGHSSMIRSISLSPDSQRVVSGSDDHTIRIWDTDTAPTVSTPLEAHTLMITSVAFSPDSKRVISGSSDKTIRIWDAATGTVISTLKGHTSRVTSVAFSPDNRRIVSGSGDSTIRVWDAHTGAVISTVVQDHTPGVTSVMFSSDSRRIVSGFLDKTSRIWDVDTGAAVSVPFKGHSSLVSSVSFSPEGRRTASGSHDYTVRVWDAETGTAIWTLKHHSRRITSVGFSPNGQRIVSSSGGSIRIWDAGTGVATSAPLEGHTQWVTSVAFSPDGCRIVSGSDDYTIRIWDAGTGAAISTPLEGHTSKVTSVAFSPDGRRIVSGSHDKTIRIWNVETGAASLVPLEGHTIHVPRVVCLGDRQIDSDSESDSSDDASGDTSPIITMQNSPSFPSWLSPPDKNGWIRDSNGNLMLWIPWDCRLGLRTPHQRAMLSSNRSEDYAARLVSLDFSKFCHGYHWQNVVS